MTETTEPIFKPMTAEYLLESDWPEPEWAIEGWWTKGASGVIGGAPKSFKSTLGLEMMVSLATGVPFLGHFPTVNYMRDGHGLIIQEENSQSNIRRQLSRIAVNRGLGSLKEEDEHMWRFYHSRGTNLNLSFINLQGFSLTDPEHMGWLADWTYRHQVKYMMLDPLYMMLGGADENSGRDLRPVLLALTTLKERSGTSSILVHHTGKSAERSGGRALLGHTYLHGWYEAAMFPGARAGYLQVGHEFREMPGVDDHYVVLKPEDGTWNPILMERDSEGRAAPQTLRRKLLEDKLVELMQANPHMTAKQAADALKTGQKSIERARSVLREAGEWKWGGGEEDEDE